MVNTKAGSIDWAEWWRKVEALLFPSVPNQNRSLSWRDYLLFIGIGVPVFASIGVFVPANGFLGYDWYYYFSTGERSAALSYYPPWVTYVSYLTWPGLIGITLSGLALALYQRRASPLVMGLTFLALPALWVVFLGQIEGLVVFGLTGLPWLAPLITIKPQVGYLAFLARKQYLGVLVGWLALSVLIWGVWPLDMLTIGNFTAWQEPHDISLFPWSLPLVLVLLWFSRGDVDLLMLAGIFMLPYVHPYHYFVVLPALARINTWLAVLIIIISWLPLLANWFGPWCWHLGHLVPALLWVSLYLKQRTLQ
ncbi:MAG: hypothetical protein U0401_33040 [Anaerolineae bacterium]